MAPMIIRVLALVLITVGTGAMVATVDVARATEAPDGGQTGFGVRLLEAPSDRAEDPRARSFIIDHIPAGGVIERRVEIINATPEPAVVTLYAGAAQITEEEGWQPSAGRGGNQLSEDWITLDTPSLELAPFTNAEAVLRIEVPGDAQPGERYAVIWAERSAAAVIPEGEVGLNTRVGIRVYLSVGAGGEPTTAFEVDTMTAYTLADGVSGVRTSVRNTGQRALDFTGQLTMGDGPGGLSLAPREVPSRTLAPGQQTQLDIVLGREFPPGEWVADLILRSGSLARQSSATLTFDEVPGESEPAPVLTAGPAGRAPWILAAIALQVCVGVGIALARRAHGALAAA